MKTKYRSETFRIDIIGIQDSKSVNIEDTDTFS